MEKIFQGEITECGINEWTNNKGELRTTFRISLALTEERGMIFNIPKDSELFDRVQVAEPGLVVKVHAEPKVQNDGTIKYRAVDIEGIAQVM